MPILILPPYGTRPDQCRRSQYVGHEGVPMTRIIGSGKARWFSMMTLAWTLTGWCTSAMGQVGSPSVPPVDALPPTAISPSDSQRELLDRLRRMEERLDQVTKQNEALSHEVQELKSANRDQS